MPPGVICVFAKPPEHGKTRLATKLGARAASALAAAFFHDVWATVSRLPWARAVLASTVGDAAAFGLSGVEPWLQGDGDLGERMERIMRRALDQAPWVIAVGADSPTLSERTLEAARDALEDHDAVLGPAEDGGYYLLGLTRLPEKLLAGLPWSSPQTFAATRERLQAHGFDVALLEPGFDVDEPQDVERLRGLLREQPELAPRTAALLRAPR